LSINIKTNTANDTFLTHGFAQSQMLALERAKEDNTIPSLPWMLDQQRNKSLKNTRPTKASSINS